MESAFSLLVTSFAFGTGLGHPIHRMEVIFFPPMAFVAVEPVDASVFVVRNKIARLPILARHWFIPDFLRFPSEVLPIMGIDAETLVMLSEVKRTPNSLILEHEEVIIIDQVMDELDQNVILIVSKGTEDSVFAFF